LLSVAVLVSTTRDSTWEAGAVSHRFIEWLLLATTNPNHSPWGVPP